jgi:hypothetical protein
MHGTKPVTEHPRDLLRTLKFEYAQSERDGSDYGECKREIYGNLISYSACYSE